MGSVWFGDTPLQTSRAQVLKTSRLIGPVEKKKTSTANWSLAIMITQAGDHASGWPRGSGVVSNDDGSGVIIVKVPALAKFVQLLAYRRPK